MARITMGARGETGEGATGRSDLYRPVKTIVERLIASLPIPGTPRSVSASAVPTAPRPGPIPGHCDSLGPDPTVVKNGYMLVSGWGLSQSGIEDVQVVVGHARGSLSYGLDEQNLAVAYNDVDMCLRIRERGFRVVYTPHVVLFHHESATKNVFDNPGEVESLPRRWGTVVRHDLFYRPNLTRKAEDYALNFDPPAISGRQQFAARLDEAA